MDVNVGSADVTLELEDDPSDHVPEDPRESDKEASKLDANIEGVGPIIVQHVDINSSTGLADK